jgi:MinD-like ATPase involved in chromosome partitioning or flagellar assembly
LAGTSTTAAILAASAAAIGRPAPRSGPGDAPHATAPRLIDAGAELAAVRDALARNPGALLLVVTGTGPASLAAAFALVKATAADRAEIIVVGGDSAEAAAAHARLDEGARHFLGRPLPLAAAVPEDPSLAVALAAGMPVHEAAAGSPAAAALHALAERAALAPAPPPALA